MRSCEAVRAELKAYLDGECGLLAKARVRRHLDGCDACREEAASLTRIAETLRAAPAADPPPALRDRILTSLPEPAAPRPLVRWVPIGALAGALAAVGLAIGFLWRPAMSPVSKGMAQQDAAAFARHGTEAAQRVALGTPVAPPPGAPSLMGPPESARTTPPPLLQSGGPGAMMKSSQPGEAPMPPSAIGLRPMLPATPPSGPVVPSEPIDAASPHGAPEASMGPAGPEGPRGPAAVAVVPAQPARPPTAANGAAASTPNQRLRSAEPAAVDRTGVFGYGGPGGYAGGGYGGFGGGGPGRAQPSPGDGSNKRATAQAPAPAASPVAGAAAANRAVPVDGFAAVRADHAEGDAARWPEGLNAARAKAAPFNLAEPQPFSRAMRLNLAVEAPVELRVARLAHTVTLIRKRVREAGGVVQRRRRQWDAGGSRVITLTVRVPAERAEALRAAVEQLAALAARPAEVSNAIRPAPPVIATGSARIARETPAQSAGTTAAHPGAGSTARAIDKDAGLAAKALAGTRQERGKRAGVVTLTIVVREQDARPAPPHRRR